MIDSFFVFATVHLVLIRPNRLFVPCWHLFLGLLKACSSLYLAKRARVDELVLDMVKNKLTLGWVKNKRQKCVKVGETTHV